LIIVQIKHTASFSQTFEEKELEIEIEIEIIIHFKVVDVSEPRLGLICILLLLGGWSSCSSSHFFVR